MIRWVGWIAKSLTVTFRSDFELFSEPLSSKTESLRCLVLSLSAFLSPIKTGGRPVMPPRTVMLEDIGENGTSGGELGDTDVPELISQLFDLRFLAKNSPATPLQDTMAVSSSSSQPMKAAETPHADGSSENPFSRTSDA